MEQLTIESAIAAGEAGMATSLAAATRRKCRARRTDPVTSKAAAVNADKFATSHYGRILAALEFSCTAHELAHATGLTVVQIDRRLPELQRAGKVFVITRGGEPLIRDGFRVWARF